FDPGLLDSRHRCDDFSHFAEMEGSRTSDHRGLRTPGNRYSVSMKGLNDYMRLLLERRLTGGVSSRAGLLLGLLVALNGLSLAETPSTTARRVSSPITLDGKLNEPEWKDAQVIKLVQQAPHPGAETPYITEVRVLVGPDAIYFGILCHDPNPKAIAM